MTVSANFDITFMGTNKQLDNFNAMIPMDITAIPEPATIALLGFGAIGTVLKRHKPTSRT